jgi:hypothetical protein
MREGVGAILMIFSARDSSDRVFQFLKIFHHKDKCFVFPQATILGGKIHETDGRIRAAIPLLDQVEI